MLHDSIFLLPHNSILLESSTGIVTVIAPDTDTDTDMDTDTDTDIRRQTDR